MKSARNRADRVISTQDYVRNGKLADHARHIHAKLCRVLQSLYGRKALLRVERGEQQLQETEMNGAALIAEERQRQAAGWSPEHDNEHDYGELAAAAACYALFAAQQSVVQTDGFDGLSADAPEAWPWKLDGSWKPADRRRNLIRAGALIAAEIDRLDRLKG